MIATDGRPTIANSRALRVTSRTKPNGVQEYYIVDFLNQRVEDETYTSAGLALQAIKAMQKGK